MYLSPKAVAVLFDRTKGVNASGRCAQQLSSRVFSHPCVSACTPKNTCRILAAHQQAPFQMPKACEAFRAFCPGNRGFVPTSSASSVSCRGDACRDYRIQMACSTSLSSCQYSRYNLIKLTEALNDGHVSYDMMSAFPGSFNDWQEPVELHKASDSQDWSVTLAVPPGTQQVAWRGYADSDAHSKSCHDINDSCSLQYKFLVDKAWRTSPCEPTVVDDKVRHVLAANSELRHCHVAHTA